MSLLMINEYNIFFKCFYYLNIKKQDVYEDDEDMMDYCID